MTRPKFRVKTRVHPREMRYLKAITLSRISLAFRFPRAYAYTQSGRREEIPLPPNAYRVDRLLRMKQLHHQRAMRTIYTLFDDHGPFNGNNLIWIYLSLRSLLRGSSQNASDAAPGRSFYGFARGSFPNYST